MPYGQNPLKWGVLRKLAFLFWCIATAAAAEPAGWPMSSTNIFAPPLRDYLEVTKPRITVLILVCTAVG